MYENIFFTSIVSLQLTFVGSIANETVPIWKNPRLSSARICRPIKIEFLRESVEPLQKQ